MIFRRRAPRSVTVYTGAGCHLCEEALEVLGRYRRRYRLDVRTVPIDGDAALSAEFGHEIPVVFIDGRRRFCGRIDPVLLRRVLDAPVAPGTGSDRG